MTSEPGQTSGILSLLLCVWQTLEMSDNLHENFTVDFPVKAISFASLHDRFLITGNQVEWVLETFERLLMKLRFGELLFILDIIGRTISKWTLPDSLYKN